MGMRENVVLEMIRRGSVLAESVSNVRRNETGAREMGSLGLELDENGMRTKVESSIGIERGAGGGGRGDAGGVGPVRGANRTRQGGQTGDIWGREVQMGGRQ